MLEREVVRSLWWKQWHRSDAAFCPGRSGTLISGCSGGILVLVLSVRRFALSTCMAMSGGIRDCRSFSFEVSALFVVPGGFVVHLLFRIEPGVEAIVGEFKSFSNDEGGVGVVDEVTLGDAVVFDGVANYAAQEGDVGTGADLHIHVRVCGGAGQARIDNDGFRVAVNFGFNCPFEAAGMVLGGIAAHDQHHVGVLDVDPAIGHCAASEGGPQTGDRWAVSNAGLVFQVADPQAAHTFYDEIIKFVGVGAAAGEGNAFAAIDSVAGSVLLDKCVVARLLHLLRNLGVGLVPRYVFPVGGSGTPHLRLQQAAFVENVLLERRSLGAECAAVDGVIGIAFDVHDLRDRVLGLVAQGVDDHTTTDGTIRTGAAGFAGARDLERIRLGVNRSQIKAEGGETGAAKHGAFEKSPTRELHFVAPVLRFPESYGGEWLQTPRKRPACSARMRRTITPDGRIVNTGKSVGGGLVRVRPEEHENHTTGDRNVEPDGERKAGDPSVHREPARQREKESREHHRQRDNGKDYVAGANGKVKRAHRAVAGKN